MSIAWSSFGTAGSSSRLGPVAAKPTVAPSGASPTSRSAGGAVPARMSSQSRTLSCALRESRWPASTSPPYASCQTARCTRPSSAASAARGGRTR
ncbi:MAG TPA: hypothetical protein VGP36_10620 [Mycobacteriales bacterium]|nr:hypothetical protein [Mycobacteriales bacterium]